MINTIGLLVSATLTLIPYNTDHKPKPVTQSQANITQTEFNPHPADFNESAMTMSTWGESVYYIDLTPAELIPLPKTEYQDKQVKSPINKKQPEIPLSTETMKMGSLTLKSSETSEPEITSNPQPDPTPLPLTISNQTSPHPLDSSILHTMINNHRTQLGLAAYQEDASLCAIADQRLPQLAEEIMGPKPMHAGLKAMSLPIKVTENLIHMATEEKAFAWWLNSPVHRRSIESSKYTHSCGRCIGNSCVQVFSDLSPTVQMPPQI